MKKLNFSVFALLITVLSYGQSEVKNKFTSPDKVKPALDFPGEGRKGKNGKGFSANLALRESPIQKVALVSFFVFDPGYTSSYSISSENLTHTSRTTTIRKRSTGGLTADIAVGALEQSHDTMKAGFKSCGIDLLMPWEFLDSDEKNKAYTSFKVEQEKNFANWIQTVGAKNHDIIYGYPEGFNLIDIVKEPYPNYEKEGLFAIKRDKVGDKKVFFMNKDTKMTEGLGYELATQLGVDAVIVSYITVWSPGKGKIKLENVNMQMFGPNPVMPEGESSHGVIPHVKGQFYVGARAIIESDLYNYNKKDESSYGLDFAGFEHIYAALINEMCSYIQE